MQATASARVVLEAPQGAVTNGTCFHVQHHVSGVQSDGVGAVIVAVELTDFPGSTRDRQRSGTLAPVPPKGQKQKAE